MPLISVIIPTYNRLASLQRAVDSVCGQLGVEYEIIVIDDGSTDGTAEWLGQQSTSIRSLIQNNEGVSHARNRGIDIARGTWLALLDSDDYWHPHKLSCQLAALDNDPDIRVCHCDEIWIRDGQRVNPADRHKKRGGDIFAACLKRCLISPSAVILHRTIIDDYGAFDEELPACEDYDLWLRITASEPVLYLDKHLLTKTGGHSDQLSRRYPIMDRFRLKSIANLVRSGALNKEQQQEALCEFEKKYRIVRNGALKHNNSQLLHDLQSGYADILISHGQTHF